MCLMTCEICSQMEVTWLMTQVKVVISQQHQLIRIALEVEAEFILSECAQPSQV